MVDFESFLDVYDNFLKLQEWKNTLQKEQENLE